MSKRSVKQRETQLAASNGTTGKELEQTITVDDSFLPSPAELQQYKEIDPKIVDLLCRMSEREQTVRHRQDEQKIKIVKRSESRQYKINIWGMFFAFLALIVMMCVTAFALYLNRPWIASIFGVLSVSSVIGLFIVPRQKD